jgi:hypothetical protein
MHSFFVKDGEYSMTDHVSFRQRLDAVLRTLDVKQVQDFLIVENQWSVDTPENPELAMWLMVAGSPTLKDLHGRAREWLVAHGHQEEADAILGRSQKQRPSSSGKRVYGRSHTATKQKDGKRFSPDSGKKYKR